MPQAVTHLLVPLVIGSLIKDLYEKKKGAKSFSLRYVLIAGIGGVLPDIDIMIFWVLYFFGFTIESVHRTFTHTLFVPIIFLILGFTLKGEIKKLKLNIVFLMLSFGIFVHLILDAALAGYIMPIYPFSTYVIGLNLIGRLPFQLQGLALPTLEGVLLVLWIIYLEFKKKISDFI